MELEVGLVLGVPLEGDPGEGSRRTPDRLSAARRLQQDPHFPGAHLHPLSTISGTYYVATPPRSAGLKFEDPRLERYMAAPPRLASARRGRRPWVLVAARTGGVVLFESWLRHEVPANDAAAERVSISFNYSWF